MTLHNCIRDMTPPGAAIGADRHSHPGHHAAKACEDSSSDDEIAVGGYDG
jgi:hypothetical protein